MKYGLMHNSKGEWWVVQTQYPMYLPDLLIYQLKATSNSEAKREARVSGYNV